MITNFNAELNGVVLEFKTMNVVKLQLFQVYTIYGGKKTKFHMQRNPEGAFYITDPSTCPEPYRIGRKNLTSKSLRMEDE